MTTDSSSSFTYLDATRKMPLVELPVRSAVIALDRGRILLSPAMNLTDAEIEETGAITDIVAPNLFHLDGVPRAAAKHPNARVWGPVGAKEKLPDVTWQGILGVDDWTHEKELAHVGLAGMPTVNESVFTHRASRTLLVSDLVFNIRGSRGFGPWLIFSLFGTKDRFGVSRFFSRMAKDKAAFEGSLKDLFALDFDAIVPSHGNVVPSGAKELLREALAERGYAVR